MSGDGWQQVRAPTTGQQWIRPERVPGGWLLVVEMESPAGGASRMAEYGPVASLGRVEGLRLTLLRDLASVAQGDVPGVLARFGLPGIPGKVATWVAAMAAGRNDG